MQSFMNITSTQTVKLRPNWSSKGDFFNAVFMDIMLDRQGLNGIETALELRKTAKRLPLVFITSERDYSLQGYRAHPPDYPLKPVEEKALAWCLDEIRTFQAAHAFRFLN